MTQLLKTLVAKSKVLFAALFVLTAGTISAATVQLAVVGSTDLSTVSTGNQFIYTLNYQCSGLTDDGHNVVATMPLPQNLVPFDISNFSNSVSYSPTQVNSVTYNSGTNTITITFVNPLPAGSTGQLQIKFKYLNGTTPNNYSPDLFAYIDADNNLNTDGGSGPVYSDTINVVATATNKFTLGKQKTAGGAIDDVTIYKLSIGSSGSGSGALTLSNPTLVDTLPLGVVFVEATSFSGSNAPVYNAMNRTVTWTWTSGLFNVNYSGEAYLVVKYTTPTYAISSNVCNNATVTGNIPVLPIGNSAASSKNGSTCFSVASPTPGAACSGGQIIAATASLLDKHILSGTTCNTFKNGWFNSGNTELDSVYLTYTVDKSIDMNVITLRPVVDGLGRNSQASIKVEYATNLNGFVTQGTYLSLTIAALSGSKQDLTISLPSGEYITQVRFTVTGALPIGGSQDFSYCGDARSTAEGAKDGSPITEGITYNPSNVGDDGTVVTNNSSGKYFYLGVQHTYSNCTGQAEIMIPQPVFTSKSKSILNSTTSLNASDTISYRVQLNLGGNLNATSVVVTDTLDSRLTYIAGSSQFTIGSGSPTTIIPVINGNVLVWNLGTLAYGVNYRISFKASINPGTLPGTVPNRISLFSGNGLFNGNTSNVTATVISSVALRAFKGQGGCDPSLVYYPTFAVAQEGGPVNYKITIKNLGNVAAKDLVMVDVFPFVGDIRGSQWFANLVGPVVISDPNSTVYYTTTSNPCYSDFTPAFNPGGCNSPSWSVTPPVDITTVKAIKITRSAVLPALDSIILSWPMRAPVGTPVNRLMNNSIMYQVRRADNNSQLLPATPQMVGMYTNCVPVLGSLGNYVWIDVNKNGLQDEAASLGLNGVKVYLYGAGGDDAIGGGDDVLLDSTVTANNFSGNPGYYKFIELASGKYYVKFQTYYNQFLLTPVTIQTNQVDGNNDADVNGLSELVTINASGTGQDKDNTTIDAGYYPIGTLGNYVWYDTNHNGLQDEPSGNGINGVKVYLYKDNGSSYVVIDSTITANNAGGNPGYYGFTIVESGNYKVLFPMSVSTKVITSQTATAGTDNNSDANTLTGFSPVIVMNLLGSGVAKNNPTIDAGYFCNVSTPVVNGNSALCGTGSTLLTSTAGYSYQWYKDGIIIPGAIAQTYSASESAAYSVVITDEGGCSSAFSPSVSINVTPKPNAAFGINNASQCLAGNSFTFTNHSRAGNFTQSIWSSGTIGGTPSVSDNLPVELGVKFKATTAGTINGIRFYKLAGSSGPFVGKLYTSSGTLLASAIFSGVTASGWQEVSFSVPVNITANTTYVASYYAPSGGYAFDANYFASSAVTNANLKALKDGEDGGNGVFFYGTGGGFPNSTYNSANYWVDVVFEPNTGSVNEWSFGDATTDNSANPGKTYTGNGDYNVKLVVTNTYGCKDSVIQPVHVGNPTAAFSFANLCNGNVRFINESSNATDYEWIFGNGNYCTNSNDDFVHHFSYGTYEVTLVARNNGQCADTVRHTVAVLPSPMALFSANPTGCTKQVTFSNLSVNGSHFFWDFGVPLTNADTSNLQNTAFTFPADGSYNVRLIAYNGEGCADTIVKTVVVNSSGITPSASFTFNLLPGSCVTRLAFTNTSTNAVSYEWIFDDGTKVNAVDINKSFPTAGPHHVILVAKSSTGCYDTADVTVVIPTSSGGPIALFSVNDDEQCLTNNSFDFINNSYFVGGGWNTSYTWDFGDGNTNTTNTFIYSKKYLNPGIYTIRLIATGSNGCRDTAYQSVEVLPSPVANFTASTYCGMTAQINNSSTGAMAYLWSYGDGESEHIDSTTFLYTYQNQGWYLIHLTAIGANGCTTEAEHGVISTKATLPVITFSYDTIGCSQAIRFINTTQGASEFKWDFGDGSPYSYEYSPVKAYNASGVYSVTLTASNGPFCMSTLTVNVNAPHGWNINLPKAGFNHTVSACNNTISAWDTSDYATSTQWFFDGVPAGTNTYFEASNPAAGGHILQLVVSNGSCWDTTSRFILIQSAPTATFSFQASSCSRTVLFTSNTTNASLQKWSFGDPASTLDSAIGSMVSHTFSGNGDFIVSLTVTNLSGCTTTFIDTITVNAASNALNASFYYNNTLCNCFCSNKIRFINTSTGSGHSYLWNFGDGNTSTQASPNKGYASSGYFNATLTVIDSTGCSSTASSLVYVPATSKGPSAAFTTDNQLQCLSGNNFNFYNTSAYLGAGWIPKYYWYFGDGTLDSTNSFIFNKHYASAGIYTVMLVAVGSDNCRDTITMKVEVRSSCFNISVPVKMFNVGKEKVQAMQELSSGVKENSTGTNNWNLYPNPNSGSFSVSGTNIRNNTRVEVMDILGRTIPVQVTRHPAENRIVLDCHNIQEGNYFVVVYNESGIESRLKFNVTR